MDSAPAGDADRDRDRDRDRRLKEQVEQILDESTARKQEIIVRMGTDETIDPQVIEAISEGIHRRALSTTARDVLPAPGSLGSLEEKRTRSQSRELARADKSISAQLAFRALSVATTAALQEVGLASLLPLVNSSIVKSLGSEIVQSLLGGTVGSATVRRRTQSARERPSGEPWSPFGHRIAQC